MLFFFASNLIPVPLVNCMEADIQGGLTHSLLGDILGCLRNADTVVVGICGAQGSGKSTLSRNLASELQNEGIDCAVVSLDDFYLPKHDRLIRAESIHPLLATRGVPGTHDIQKLYETVQSLRDTRIGEVKWPIFSKLDDDRKQGHARVCKRSDAKLVIVLEGWCVGCMQLTDVATSVNELERNEDSDLVWRHYIDSQIRERYSRAWDLIDMLIYLRVPDWETVSSWRSQQALSGGEDLAKLNVGRFLQFFERISKQMMESNRRRMKDIEVVLGPNHSVREIRRLLQ